uniref:Transmembrane protein 56-B n=1 Tax=Phallusia mammillata TaxID=59560 RepID=A0A6F9DU72_9ASCI|nr:transmembrane protein 56-B [Phallusia mammillata]
MNNLQCGLASFVFFLYFYKHMSPALSGRIPKFNRLTKDEKTEWHARNASTLHAVVVTLLAMYVLLFEEHLRRDIIWGRSTLSECSLSICVGYLLSDLYLIFTNYEAVGGTVGFIIHHCVSAYAYVYGLSGSVLLPVANFRLLAEMSTPFVNLRWALSTTGNKDSELYFYNGLLLTFSFFISRILPMPFFYYMVISVQSLDSYSRVSLPCHISWIGVCMVLDVMNLMWFKKIMSGILTHVIKRSKASETPPATHNGTAHKIE